MADFMRSGSVEGATHTSALSGIKRGMALKQNATCGPRE